jgi:hypothetical protein
VRIRAETEASELAMMAGKAEAGAAAISQALQAGWTAPAVVPAYAAARGRR